jgi:glycosyltransferase involved in cell wall biosynthesis
MEKIEGKKNVLFLCIHRPDRSPTQRFRFEQYINYLNDNGFNCKHFYIIEAKDDKVFYSNGNFLKKAILVLKFYFKLLKLTFKEKNVDLCFVQREAFVLGTTYFERFFAKRAKMIFDFDDSIWLQNVSEANKKFVFLKNPNKTKELIKISNLVFAGNQYLADFAKNINPHVIIVPTTIETNLYKPTIKSETNKVVIGWSGSVTTIQHFNYAVSALKKIKARYNDLIDIRVVGDGNYVNEELGVKGLPWKKESELDDLGVIDIGIMPLPDDEWSKGKCGLKGLQYMALGIATIMSPVGVNTEIIQDGENGFLAKNEEEWIEKLSLLIENKALRKTIGDQGRKTVVEKYSVDAVKEIYLNCFNDLVRSK